MKIIFASLVLITAFATGSAQSALTNDMIIKLAASGMPEGNVIGIIHSQAGAYTTEPGDLAKLQKAGVTANEIAAMLQQGGGNNTVDASEASSGDLVLRDGTPIRLRLTRTLSSADVSVGDKIDFDVLDDVRVGNQVLIPKGTKAIGSITEAEHKRRMGRAGKINFMLEQVRLSDDTKVALRASRQVSGGGHVGAMAAGMVATSLFVWPAAPLLLLMHGKDAVISEGTEVIAYVDGDVHPSASAMLAQRH